MLDFSPHLKRSRQRGFSIVEVLIAAGIMGIVSMGILSVTEISNRGSSEANIRLQAEDIKRNIINYIQDSNAWANTVAAASNTNLACLKNVTDCWGVSGSFKLMDGGASGGTVVYDPSAAANGFDLQGALCTAFDTTDTVGNNKCPFRMDLSWSPSCPGAGSCTNPGVKIRGTFYFRPKKQDTTTNIALSTATYSFDIIRGGASTSQGTGTVDTLTKWVGASVLGSSSVYESGNNIGIGTSVPGALLNIVAPDAGPWAFSIRNNTYTTSENNAFRIFQTNAGVVGFQNAGVSAISIATSGNVGIGSTSPAQKLDVAGTVQATAYLYSSDERLKENIQSSAGLSDLLRLRGVKFNWKKDREKDAGIIAQEVEKVLPELVKTNPETGLKSVKYGGLLAPIIESIKELYYRQSQQRTELQRLQKENADLKLRLERLEATLKWQSKQ